jgi:hypothetical protein
MCRRDRCISIDSKTHKTILYRAVHVKVSIKVAKIGCTFKKRSLADRPTGSPSRLPPEALVCVLLPFTYSRCMAGGDDKGVELVVLYHG